MSMKHPGTAAEVLSSAPHVVARCSESPEPISREELHAELAVCDGVVSILADRYDDAVFTQFPRLKVVANVAVGFDNIDVAAANKHGVLVVNTPGVLDDATADLAFALMLATSRRLVEADKYVRDGQWKKFKFDLLLGTELAGKTLGVVGMGRIGRAMARRARAFGMRIVYSQRTRVPVDVEAALADRDGFGAEHLPLDELLRRSDFVSLHCPLTQATRHLLSDREFALMKPSAILVNTARGAIVDEAALVRALTERRIHAAGLDVFEHEPKVSPELLTMPNVVLAPHIGSATVETRSAMALLAVNGLLSALQGALPMNAVNPEVWKRFLQRLHSESAR
jgi:glyoxylate reductase